MTLFWNKCVGGVWCNFRTLNLAHEAFNDAYGVYIIWQNNITLKVGAGEIRHEIGKDRISPTFLPYNDTNTKVTWARVGRERAESVRNYFISTLHPKFDGDLFTFNSNEPSNYPWT
jgi:hypothetical protein